MNLELTNEARQAPLRLLEDTLQSPAVVAVAGRR
jgi:hypothetical protein